MGPVLVGLTDWPTVIHCRPLDHAPLLPASCLLPADSCFPCFPSGLHVQVAEGGEEAQLYPLRTSESSSMQVSQHVFA